MPKIKKPTNPVKQKHLDFLDDLKRILLKHHIKFMGTGGGNWNYVVFEDGVRISSLEFNPEPTHGGNREQPISYSFYDSYRI